MAIGNNTAYNTSFHQDYRDALLLGLRCPIDDRGSLSLGDRPFALGNHIVGWKEGSINLALKSLLDFRGQTVDLSDLTDFNAGLLDIPRINRYVDLDMLYGYKGTARGLVPNDMMSYRGYPTYEISEIVYDRIELNQDTILTQNTGNENITCTNNNIYNQVKRDYGTVFPVTTNNDYVIVSGYVTLKKSVPFSSIHISLKQKMSIQDSITLDYDDMWSGTFEDSDWATKTECHSDGSGTRFWFRLEAELSDAVLDDGIDFSDKVIFLKIENDVTVSPYGDDYWYGSPIIATTGVQFIAVTWNGTKWIGSGTAYAADVTPPSIPLNLAVDSNVSTSLTLSWDASTDDFGVREYEVSVTKFGVEELFITTDTTIDLTVEGGAEYTFKVRAYDYAYNVSDWSTQLVYTTVALVLEVVYCSIFYGETSALGCAEDVTVPRYVFDKIAMLDGTYTGTVYNDSSGSVVVERVGKWWNFGKYAYPPTTKSIQITNGLVTGYVPC